MSKKYRPKTPKVSNNNNAKPIQKIKALTENQKEYIESIKDSEIIACTGPSGTGKSYIACGLAIELLSDIKRGFKKIIIVRPIVECGNKIGFLPGDVSEKVGPYIQFFLDTFEDFLDKEDIESMMEYGVIDVQPLELMRGKTFKNCIVICDECQNASMVQMKCLLTRFGDGSKMILCGDYTQSDIDRGGQNDFEKVCDLLDNIDDNSIATVELDINDVVRHRLVKKILEKFP